MGSPLDMRVLSFVIFLSVVNAQIPPRLQIPGALLTNARPLPLRGNPRIQQDIGPRPRRPIPPVSNALPLPIREVRPVIEENEERPTSNFDQEVNNLGISVLQSAVRDAVSSEEEGENYPRPAPSPLPFRPERPVPITRDQIRESRPPIFRQDPPQQRIPQQRQEPRPLPILRQERPRQELRQELEDENIAIRQPVRQQLSPSRPPPQNFRGNPPARVAPRPPLDDDDRQKIRKPTSQILKKYRTDNEDGSITWGFENDDGTWKEETLGTDCVIRGRYGYVDPDGVKREYNYETGNKCDPTEEEEEEELAAQNRKPNIPPRKNQGPPQYRPAPLQYPSN